MAEGALNHLGQGRIAAYSAGSKPAGYVHPKSLELLALKGISIDGFRSKSWDEFGDTSFDAVITVCDNAAGEACPVFIGAPVKAHWGVADPAHVTGTEAEVMAAFNAAYQTLEARIKALLALPQGLDKKEFAAALRHIGETVS